MCSNAHSITLSFLIEGFITQYNLKWLKRYNENSLIHKWIYRFTYQIYVVLTIGT